MGNPQDPQVQSLGGPEAPWFSLTLTASGLILRGTMTKLTSRSWSMMLLAAVLLPRLTPAQAKATCGINAPATLPGQAGLQNDCSVSVEQKKFQAMAIDNASQTGLDLQPGFTIEAWVQLASAPPDTAQGLPGNYVIASKFSGEEAGASYIFRYQNVGGVFNLDVSVATAPGVVPTLGVIYELPIREWHHVAVTYGVDGTAEFFVDGVSIGTVPGGPTSIKIGNGGFAIGAFVNPSWYGPLISDSESLQFFDGVLDEVRVWNIVRTPAEIADAMSREISPLTSGLVGYWQFDRHSGADSTPNHNDLTNFGATFTRNVPFRRF
jgi:hypothetical protein